MSKNWRTWTVNVVKKLTDRTIVTIQNDFSQAKCTKHYIDDYSEKKDACKGTVWADRVHMHKYPGQWTIKPAKGKDGKCFNIINHEKPAGCLRYLSANSNCKERHLKLVEKDDESGLQQWKFVEVGGGGGNPSPSPSLPPGSTCVSTGPNNCAGCCQTKFEKNDGSFVDDPSCWKVDEYPQCDFEVATPLPPNPPARSKPKIVSTSSGSSNAGRVVFEPEQGAVECFVSATPQGGGSTVTSTVVHPLSYPTTSVDLHNLKEDAVYEIVVRCKGDDGKEEAASNEKTLHTAKSDAHPGVVNLHPTSPTSVAFHIVAPNASECDAEKYDVLISKQGGSTSKTTVSQVDVVLSGLDPNTKYEVAVDAVCKGGSTSKKSAPAFVTTPVVPAPTPQPTTPSTPSTPGPPTTVLEKAPEFHTITVFGRHPGVSVFLNGAIPTGTTVVVDVDCTNGFKSSVSAPAAVPETTLHLATGLPPGTTCMYTAYTANGSKKSPTATAQRIVPSSALESPSLVNWNPNYKTKGGTVTVVAPQAVNCTGGIVEYTITGNEPSRQTALIGRKRRLLQTPAFTVTSPSPGMVTIKNGVNYDSGPNTLDMEVVGKCADGSVTPSGHLSVNLAICPAIPNCATPDNAGGSCECQTCASGYALSSTGYVCNPAPLLSPAPSPVPTGPPSFVEFRGDGTLIATQEQVKVDFTFTTPCGSTFSESDPAGTTKCDWERIGTTDLSARSPGLAPGVYQYTVDGAVCPASKAGICTWSAYLYRDNPVTPTCKQTNGLPAGICRTAVDLQRACGSQCQLKQGEKKTLSFTVNPDESVSFT